VNHGRAALIRGYPRSFETAEQISRGAAQLALYDLPDDYFSTFMPKVLAVDEAAVTRAATQHIDPARLLTVIVGDREKVGPGLPRLNLGTVTEVVPA
jgi:zinc protease